MIQRYEKDISKTMHDRHMKQMDVTKPIGASTDFVNMPKTLSFKIVKRGKQ
jgi:hypothetical protein